MVSTDFSPFFEGFPSGLVHEIRHVRSHEEFCLSCYKVNVAVFIQGAGSEKVENQFFASIEIWGAEVKHIV
jgi:hypothetical protein